MFIDLTQDTSLKGSSLSTTHRSGRILGSRDMVCLFITSGDQHFWRLEISFLVPTNIIINVSLHPTSYNKSCLLLFKTMVRPDPTGPTLERGMFVYLYDLFLDGIEISFLILLTNDRVVPSFVLMWKGISNSLFLFFFPFLILGIWCDSVLSLGFRLFTL